MHFQSIATSVLVACAATAEIAAARRLGNPNAPGQLKKQDGAVGTQAAPCDGDQTSKVLQPTDAAVVKVCTNDPDGATAYDGIISDFKCVKESTEKFGQIIISTDRDSIVEGFRVYANTITNNGEALDPIKYKVEARGDGPSTCYRVNDPGEEESQAGAVAGAEQPWQLISKGDLVWPGPGGDSPERNVAGESVVSSFLVGDQRRSYAGVRWVNDGSMVDEQNFGSECTDYRISFLGGRDGGDTFAFGEIELVGTVTSACPGPVTSPPTRSPTGPVTSSPTSSPTPRPTESPNNPQCPDLEVANILLKDDQVDIEGCSNAVNPENAFDGTTAPFTCEFNVAAEKGNGIIVRNPRKNSVAKGLRVYTGPNAGKAPIYYKVEGRGVYGDDKCYRVNAAGEEEAAQAAAADTQTQPWKLISKGLLPWSESVGGNAAADMNIDGSDFTTGDSDFNYTAVMWTNDGTLVEGNVQDPPLPPSECIDYRITFGGGITREARETEIEIGEIELVGTITESCSLTAPTSAPIGGCDAITKKSTCNALDECNWKRRKCNPV